MFTRGSLPALGLLLAIASPASAQINLAWNNCITQATAAANKSYACDGSLDGIPQRIVVSFVAPTSIPRMIVIDAILELSTGAAILPDYWRLGVNECRAGALNIGGNFTGIGTGTTGACQNPWSNQAGGGFEWTSGSPGPGRATLVPWRGDAVERSLTAGQQYVALYVTMDPVRALEQGPCAGCEIPACLTLNQVRVIESPGVPEHILTTPDVRNYVTWQGGTPDCAGATPTRNQTWGTIKAIYR